MHYLLIIFFILTITRCNFIGDTKISPNLLTANPSNVNNVSGPVGYVALTGTLSGKLPESTGLVLQSATGETLALNDNGAFTFLNPYTGSLTYSVSIQSQPINNTCTISNNSGSLPSASALNISVTCTPSTYTLGGIITGLGAGETILVKGNNTSDSDTNQDTFTGVGADFSYTLPQARYAGRYYSLSILSSSPTKYCTFSTPSKKEGVLNSNLTDANITCTARTTGSCSKGSGELWEPDREVISIVCDGNDHLIIGGKFSSLAPSTGKGAIVDATTGALPFIPAAKVNGAVYTVIPDGKGGWYIGGDFTKVGTLFRNYIAHIYSDLSLDSTWNPNANATVKSMFLSGDSLFVGGSFTSIGGQARSRLAKISLATGLADASWTADVSTPSSSVMTMTASGTTLYIGGDFTSVKGQTRNRIAQIDMSTASVTSWDTNASNIVRTVFLSNSTLYVGGTFSTIGGQTRNKIAAIDVSTGLATVWDPNASGAGGSVDSIISDGLNIYVGGNFSTIGGQSRYSIAALDLATGLATSWNPNPNGYIKTLLLSGSTLYVGGYFTNIGGQSRKYAASLDTSTGLATSWNPICNSNVYSIGISSGRTYIGGTFTTIGAQSRNYIAALDTSTGVPTSWNPNASSWVSSLAINGTTLYVGGQFSTIGGQPRSLIAALNTTTGLATAWNPGANGDVLSLYLDGSNLYAGGTFSLIGGQVRNHIAAIDTTTGTATAWNPNADQQVSTIAIDGGNLYVGGNFTNVGGQPRNYIAALDTSTGLATAWDPNPNQFVSTIAIDGAILYAGGYFTSIGGQARNYIAALDTTTGLATAWNPSSNNNVMGMIISGSFIYTGGSFTTIGGQLRNTIAKLSDTTANADLSWNPNGSGGYVRTFHLSGTDLYVGGTFTSIGGQSRSNLAVIDILGDGTIP